MRDAGVDTGPMPMDSGPDTGPVATANVRLAYLIPDGPDMRLCISSLVGGVEAGAPTGPLPAPPDDPVPFRGITPYIPFALSAGVGYRMKVYQETDTEAGCPDASVEPVIVADIPEGAVDADAYATVALIGLLGDDNFCGPTFDQPCGETRDARVMLFEDDPAIDAENNHLRFHNSQVNAPPLDFCWDPDGSGGEMPPVELFENVDYGEVTPYLTTVAIERGLLTLHAHVAPDMDCVPEAQIAQFLVPNAFSFLAGQFGEAGVNIATTFKVGENVTLFMQGVGDPDEPFPPSSDAALLIPWRDQPPPE